MKTRLILLEGIPGSGKTTTAEWIYQRSCRQGIDAELSAEFRPDHPEHEPERYFSATQDALEKLQPSIVYLRQPDARTFMREQHAARKGDDVIAKIAAYTETTAIAKRHDWKGISGMIEFYLQYRDVCDRLIEGSRFDVLRLDTSGDDLDAVRSDLASWLARPDGPSL